MSDEQAQDRVLTSSAGCPACRSTILRTLGPDFYRVVCSNCGLLRGNTKSTYQTEYQIELGKAGWLWLAGFGWANGKIDKSVLWVAELQMKWIAEHPMEWIRGY